VIRLKGDSLAGPVDGGIGPLQEPLSLVSSVFWLGHQMVSRHSSNAHRPADWERREPVAIPLRPSSYWAQHCIIPTEHPVKSREGRGVFRDPPMGRSRRAKVDTKSTVDSALEDRERKW